MSRYFTFFFCSYSWPKIDRYILVKTFEWFFNRLDIVGKSKLNGTLKWGNTQKECILDNQVWKKYAEKIRNDEVQEMSISLFNRTEKRNFLFYLHFIGERIKYCNEYTTFLGNNINKIFPFENSIKIMSISIDKDIYDKKILKYESELIEVLMDLFDDMNCTYGYGDYTENIVHTPSAFINDNNIDLKVPIDRFNYKEYIEDVYRINFLSINHLQKLGCLNEILHNNKIEYREIKHNSSVCGAFIKYDGNKGEYDSLFNKLFSNFKEKEKKYYLLLNSIQNSLIKRKSLVDNVPSKSIQILPDDILQIEEKIPQNEADCILRTNSLQQLYCDMYPLIKTKGMYVVDLFDQYQGLFNDKEYISRVPNSIIGGNGQFLRVYTGDHIHFDRLKINFLFSEKYFNKYFAQFNSLIAQWYELVEKNQHIYGRMTLIGDLCRLPTPKNILYNLILNAVDLKQEAINLLVAIIDVLNENSCVVKYVVFGEIEGFTC